MTISYRSILGAVAASALAFAAVAPAHADSEVKVGVLTCNEASGWGFIFGSSREVHCTFTSDNRPDERYTGEIEKFGVDIGYQHAGVIVWGVLAPSEKIPAGALAGEYDGVTASATAGVGAGANLLVGGSGKTISLQPLSVSGATGLNIAAGIGELTLHPAP